MGIGVQEPLEHESVLLFEFPTRRSARASELSSTANSAVAKPLAERPIIESHAAMDSSCQNSVVNAQIACLARLVVQDQSLKEPM